MAPNGKCPMPMLLFNLALTNYLLLGPAASHPFKKYISVPEAPAGVQ